MRSYINLKCHYCSTEYTAREDQKERSKFCSRICLGKSLSGNTRNKKGVSQEQICIQCGTNFMVKASRIGKAKYCSTICSRKGSLTQRIVTCRMCQKEFKVIHARVNTAKHCSRECYHDNRRNTSKEPRICIQCNSSYPATKGSGKKFCSLKCFHIQKIKDVPVSYAAARKSIKKSGELSHCERCGYKENPHILGIHHKDRDRKNNSRDNLEVLCPNCHSLEHLHHVCHGFQH